MASITLNKPSGGALTLSVEDGTGTETITLPAITGNILTDAEALPAIDGSNLTGISSYTDSDALTLFNASGSAPVYACRAWVNFNGTGTVSINASGNVSSITDNGTGNYTINFSNAMPDNKYVVAGSNAGSTLTGYYDFICSNGSALSTTSAPILIVNNGGALYDMNMISVSILR